jgi:hypothetical protein
MDSKFIAPIMRMSVFLMIPLLSAASAGMGKLGGLTRPSFQQAVQLPRLIHGVSNLLEI